MAELADAADSKSADLRVLGVQLPLPAPTVSRRTSIERAPIKCLQTRPAAPDCARLLPAVLISLTGLPHRRHSQKNLPFYVLPSSDGTGAFHFETVMGRL